MLDHNHTTAGLLETKSMFRYTSRVQTNTQIRKFNTSGFLIRLHKLTNALFSIVKMYNLLFIVLSKIRTVISDDVNYYYG